MFTPKGVLWPCAGHVIGLEVWSCTGFERISIVTVNANTGGFIYGG